MLMNKHDPTSEDLDRNVLKAKSMSDLLAPIAMFPRWLVSMGWLESISLNILLLGSFRDRVSREVSASFVFSAFVARSAMLSLLTRPFENRFF